MFNDTVCRGAIYIFSPVSVRTASPFKNSSGMFAMALGRVIIIILIMIVIVIVIVIIIVVVIVIMIIMIIITIIVISKRLLRDVRHGLGGSPRGRQYRCL